MRVKKMTVDQVHPNTKVLLKGKGQFLIHKLNSSGDLSMRVSDYFDGTFNHVATVVESPRKYGGSGVMVRFTIPDLSQHLLMFWSDFKEIIDTTIDQRDVNIDTIMNDV